MATATVSGGNLCPRAYRYESQKPKVGGARHEAKGPNYNSASEEHKQPKRPALRIRRGLMSQWWPRLLCVANDLGPNLAPANDSDTKHKARAITTRPLAPLPSRASASCLVQSMSLMRSREHSISRGPELYSSIAMIHGIPSSTANSAATSARVTRETLPSARSAVRSAFARRCAPAARQPAAALDRDQGKDDDPLDHGD
jgi:hypothetical protein